MNRQSLQLTRLVLLLGIGAGLVNVVLVPVATPEQFALASDVYLYAADAFLSGGDIYDTTPPERPGYYYLYPPIVILLFLPHALLGTELASFAIQTVVNVGFAVGTALVIWRALERRNVPVQTIDHILIVGFVLLSAHSAITLVNGQVTIPLAFGLAIGFDALDRRFIETDGHQHTANSSLETLAGIAFATAALLKVFPAAVGIWLLRVRAWRGVFAAVATGLGGLLLGAVLLGPDLTITYLEDVLLGRYGDETFDGRPAPTQSVDGVQRQLAALFGVGSTTLTVLSLTIVGAILAVLYRRLDTDERRLAAMFGTVAGILLFMPLQPLYFPLLVFPLVVLLYTLSPGWPRRLLVLGALVSFVRADYEVSEALVLAVGLPSTLESVLVGSLEAFFTFILPPTLGLWLMVVACLLIQTTDA